MGEKDTTSPPKGRLRNSTPKLSTKTSESPRNKNCTATVTLDTQIPIIITKSGSKTESGRARSKDTTTEKRLPKLKTTLKSLCSQMATTQASVVELTSVVKRNKKSLAKSECNLGSPRNKRLRIDIEDEGRKTIILLTITQKWRTLLRSLNRNTGCLEKMNLKVRETMKPI